MAVMVALMDLSKTIWRGLEIAHPPEWELAAATIPGKVPVCLFSDSVRQRMKIQWRSMKSVPDLKRLLGVQTSSRRSKSKPRIIESLPPGWHGISSIADAVEISHVGCFFEKDQLFVEMVIVWDNERNSSCEYDILEGTKPFSSSDTGVEKFKAMGFDLDVDCSYQIKSYEALPGQVSWTFAEDSNKTLTITRVSLPDYWLNAPLSEWLKGKAGNQARIESQSSMSVNGHDAVVLFSALRADPLSDIGGKKIFRVDVAWLCPVEKRVYHVSILEKGKYCNFTGEIPLKVHCCADLSPVCSKFKEKIKRDHSSKIKSPPKLEPEDILQAIPIRNINVRSQDTGDGKLLVIPIKKPSYLVPPISWILPFSKERRLKLDLIGAFVLDLCDGKRTVQDIIESFAKEHRLSLREARDPVLRFFKPLTERGVIVIAGKGDRK